MKFVLFIAASVAYAQLSLPPQLQGVGIDQHLGAQIPLKTTFIDESGQNVELGSLYHGRPVVLALVYYECPMLCSQILSGVVTSLRPLSLRAGKDFDVVAISINPNETSQEASEKRAMYTQKYGADPGWHFLTGTEPSIRAVADAVGFRYRYDPKSKMYFHASGVIVTTPDGRAARYLYGVDYEPKDMKLALVEASNRKIGSPVDQILLFCYHYDPTTGKYGAAAVNLLRAASAVTFCALACFLALMWRREVRHT
jgi:protein SCO1/2